MSKYKARMYNSAKDRYEIIAPKSGVIMAWITAECSDDEFNYWLKNTVFSYDPDLYYPLKH